MKNVYIILLSYSKLFHYVENGRDVTAYLMLGRTETPLSKCEENMQAIARRHSRNTGRHEEASVVLSGNVGSNGRHWSSKYQADFVRFLPRNSHIK